jgi:hypothetical protein
MEDRTAQFAEERERRIDAMWRRFCRAMVEQGLKDASQLDRVASDGSRCRIMLHRIQQGQPAGWRFRSALEAFDLGMCDYRPSPPPAPTAAAPGSAEKVHVFITRISNGFELFHPADNPVLTTR